MCKFLFIVARRRATFALCGAIYGRTFSKTHFQPTTHISILRRNHYGNVTRNPGCKQRAGKGKGQQLLCTAAGRGLCMPHSGGRRGQDRWRQAVHQALHRRGRGRTRRLFPETLSGGRIQPVRAEVEGRVQDLAAHVLRRQRQVHEGDRRVQGRAERYLPCEPSRRAEHRSRIRSRYVQGRHHWCAVP